MKKILTVLGARPQFIKASVVSAEIKKRPGVEEVVVHTGQHFDNKNLRWSGRSISWIFTAVATVK
jgi:UDP-N-acetylglucosamine 2-epimerase